MKPRDPHAPKGKGPAEHCSAAPPVPSPDPLAFPRSLVEAERLLLESPLAKSLPRTGDPGALLRAVEEAAWRAVTREGVDPVSAARVFLWVAQALYGVSHEHADQAVRDSISDWR